MMTVASRNKKSKNPLWVNNYVEDFKKKLMAIGKPKEARPFTPHLRLIEDLRLMFGVFSWEVPEDKELIKQAILL